MYVIFKEDELLEEISFWYRNDIYVNQVDYDTKYIFPKENAIKQIIDRVTSLSTRVYNGYFINYNHIPLYENLDINQDNLREHLKQFSMFFFSEGSLSLERNHIIDISLNIDFIMDQFRPNIINQKFKDYVKEELLKKKSEFRDYTINQALK